MIWDFDSKGREKESLYEEERERVFVRLSLTRTGKNHTTYEIGP